MRTNRLVARAYVGVLGSLSLLLAGFSTVSWAGDTIDYSPTHAQGVPGLPAATVEAEEQDPNDEADSRDDLDEEDLDEPHDKADVEPFAGRFKFGGEFELTRRELRNVSLGERSRDDERISELEIQTELSFRPSERLSAFAEIMLIGEQEDPADDTSRTSEGELERGETWLYFKRVFDSRYAVKVGRQNFDEPRRWWWDEDLDSVRVYYTHDPWRLYLGAAEELARTSSRDDFIDPEDDDIQRLIGQVDWQWSESFNLTAFFLSQRDHSGTPAVDSIIETVREDESDADLRWIGLRASGEVELPGNQDLSYWADTAFVEGDETLVEFDEDEPRFSLVDSRDTQRVRGWAVDLGATWTLALPGEPTLRFNYAHGSGDSDLNDNTNRAFRQTGLQDTDEEFRFYGELLRPELSNLNVATVILGLPLFGDSRLALGYHRFRQVEPAPFLRDARIDADLTGQNKDIGEEISLVVEIQQWEDLDIELAAATFKSGDAFGAAAGKRANSIFVQLTYEF